MGLERNKKNYAPVRNLSPVSIDPESAYGSPKWTEKCLSCVCMKLKGSGSNPSPLQEERLRRLTCRMQVQFDSSVRDHQEALRTLWNAAFPNLELDGLISDQWEKMGWQGKDPSTDFRGAGFIALENLLFFAKRFPASFQKLLNKEGGHRATWEYPFAVAGLNITFMIEQMLDHHSSKTMTLLQAVLIRMLSEDKCAFDLLYCMAFMVMDKLWLEMNASYMEFSEVLGETRAQLEKELLLDGVSRIEDLPSFRLLTENRT